MSECRLSDETKRGRYFPFDVVAYNGHPVKELPFCYYYGVDMYNKLWCSVGGNLEDMDWYFTQERGNGVVRLCYTAKRFLPGPSMREFDVVESLPATLWDFDARPRTLTLRVVDPHVEE